MRRKSAGSSARTRYAIPLYPGTVTSYRPRSSARSTRRENSGGSRNVRSAPEEIDATEALEDARHRPLDARPLGDVARDGYRLSASAPDLVGQRREAVRPPREERHAHAAGGEVARELRPEAARGAGHDA